MGKRFLMVVAAPALGMASASMGRAGEPLYPGEQGKPCKTNDDCRQPLACQMIGGKSMCAGVTTGAINAYDPPSSGVEVQRCTSDADCDPGYTCGGNFCAIEQHSCSTDVDCPKPLICDLVTKTGGLIVGNCMDSRYLKK